MLLADEDGGVGDDAVEDGGVAEVDEGVEGEVLGEEFAEFFAVTGAVEFVGGDEGEDAIGFEQSRGAFVEINEEIGGAGVGGVAFGLDEGFLIFDEFLQDQEKLIPQAGESDDSDELDARLNLIVTRLAEIERNVRPQIR